SSTSPARILAWIVSRTWIWEYDSRHRSGRRETGMAEHKPLVLIADDQEHAVVLLRRIFQRDGFEVESATDGEIALEKARSLRPDLILMDVQMPKVNGFEVTRQL